MASIWKIAIKISLGKLIYLKQFSDLQNDIFSNGFHLLPLTFQHINELLDLPFFNRDPFDRILIAQAKTEHLILLTKDDNLKKYPVQFY